VAMVDEHYYRAPEWFWENLHRYDSYDRNGPKVYAGEYAAHEPDRRNTLRSALAEAAGFVGFENNGDVVSLASYAPLLARRGNTQWTPDMIYFNSTQVFPSINYQAQQLFGTNSGDRLVSSKLEGVTPGTRVAVSTLRDSSSGTLIIKIVNGEARDLPLSLNLSSGAASKYELTLTQFGHPNADLVNEDGKPQAITPVTETSQVAPRFERRLPAHSITVLRLK